MEAFLNILWLAICTVLLLAWRGHWLAQVRRRAHGGAALQSFLSLVCLLALLFPAISLSDDLRPVMLALPDSKSSSVVALSHFHSSARQGSPGVTRVHLGSPVA